MKWSRPLRGPISLPHVSPWKTSNPKLPFQLLARANRARVGASVSTTRATHHQCVPEAALEGAPARKFAKSPRRSLNGRVRSRHCTNRFYTNPLFQ
jgi:hypothetical protein